MSDVSFMYKTLEELIKGGSWIGLGIAGNQADHLNQAGESDDFKDVITEGNAPKGIFPWYVPTAESFLSVNPLCSDSLKLRGNVRAQPEPEISLLLEFSYSECGDDLLDEVSALGFSVFNDCSRRVPEDKISYKKNWGSATQGMAAEILPLSDFSVPGGSIEQFRLACFLRRDGVLIPYGEDTAVSDYCYFNQRLLDWVKGQINTQEEFGPLEKVRGMIGRPQYGVICIGATRYSEFGNSAEKFLREGDEVLVGAYDVRRYEQACLAEMMNEGKGREGFLLLRQRVSED